MKKLPFSCFVLLVASAGITSGATYSLPLPEFQGVVSSNSSMGIAPTVRATDFDFGHAFTSIEAVYIDFAVENEVPGMLASGESFSLPLSVQVTDEKPSSHDSARVVDDGQFGHRVFFDNPVPQYIDFYTPFRDGSGSLTLQSWAIFLSIGFNQPPEVIAPATAFINDAQLVIVGTQVPEPSAAFMIGLAIGAVSSIRHRSASH